MAKLFLSYSRSDAARAERFTKWLEGAGHDVWRDEDDIGGGASFSSEIERALKDCDAVLVLWSAKSVQSAWVRDEASYGRDKGKLIPLSLDGSEAPLGFRQFQSIDLSKWKGRGALPHATHIAESIERVIGSPTRLASSLPSADKTPSKLVLGASPLQLCLLIAFLVGGVVAAGLFIWGRHSSDGRIMIAVEAAANLPDRSTAVDYANVTTADLAAFLPIHTDRILVVSPGDPRSSRSDYRMEIASSRQGPSTDATLTLSDATTGDVFWSKSWNVPNATPGELRQPISLAASHAMLCLLDTITGAQRLRQPALGMYISGCAGFDDPTRSGADNQGFFEHAVQLAPNFGPGWAYLAVVRAADARNSEGKIDPASAAKARQAIAMARKLDPSNAKVFLAEAFLTDDPLRGLALFEKATALDPNDALIQASLSFELRSVGRLTDAVRAGQRAVELDPYSPWGVITYIFTLRVAGQVKEMEKENDKARKMWGETQTADANDFIYSLQYGDPRRAESLLPSLDLDEFDAEAARRTIAARLNPTQANVDAALKLYREQMQRMPSRGGAYLLRLGIFGRTDDALALLTDKSFQKGFVGWEILFTPALAHVRNDPRFMRVAADLGLLNYWRRSGHWPDFCSDPRLPYDCKAEAAKYV